MLLDMKAIVESNWRSIHFSGECTLKMSTVKNNRYLYEFLLLAAQFPDF
jgi:hypothetical protein